LSEGPGSQKAEAKGAGKPGSQQRTREPGNQQGAVEPGSQEATEGEGARKPVGCRGCAREPESE